VDEKKRRAELDEIFRDVDESEKKLVDKLIDDVVYYEAEMERLKGLPFIAIHPKDPQKQKITPAARLYKEYAASYMNALRILLNCLRKVETDAQDELLRRLEAFTVDG